MLYELFKRSPNVHITMGPDCFPVLERMCVIFKSVTDNVTAIWNKYPTS